MTGSPSQPPLEGVLVRFGEIGIKSAPVRRSMVERLRRNLLDAMLARKAEGDVKQIGARLWMVGPNSDLLADAATHTFGVVSVSLARQVPATMESMSETAIELALAANPWTSFAVRATREGDHPFTSQQIGVEVGSAVFKAAEAKGQKPKVNLGKPDFEVHVDVRKDKAFIFTEMLAGPGGIPLGSQGRVVSLLSDEPSVIATWLMMRRGCEVTPLHAGAGNISGLGALAAWGLQPVEPISPGPKAALLEAAASVARSVRGQAIVTGDTLTSELLPASLPVLRPVCGLDPDEIVRLRAAIGLVGAA